MSSNGDRANQKLHGPPALPYIADLVQKADRRVAACPQSLRQQIETAATALKQSEFLLSLKNIDQAYVEYLVASTLALNYIPHNKDYPQLSGALAERKTNLLKGVNKSDEEFQRIRDIIKRDNEQNHPVPSANGHPLPAIPSQQPSTRTQHESAVDSRSRQGGATSSDASGASRAGHAVSNSIAERFAKLRFSASQGTPVPSGSESQSPRFPDAQATNGYTATAARALGARRDSPSLHITTLDSADGAQSSPHDSRNSHRSSMSVNTSLPQELPKVPSPTYTPIRSMQSPGAIRPPRSARNTTPVTYERPSSASSTASFGSQTSARPAVTPSMPKQSQTLTTEDPVRRRRKSVNEPLETEITADRLYDYLHTFNLLLIDVRSREEYDAGHIWSRSGMCIEPTALRANMSAEELQDSLVLSPEDEQLFFDRRDEFDLVIYYDNSTTEAQFGYNQSNHSNPAMKYLQEALYEYNQEKPLRWPPILLKGGIEAWQDLLGSGALITSNTTYRARQGRPIARRPGAEASARLDILKRRRRDYNPLDPEEERKWRERAQSESMILDAQPSAQAMSDENGDDAAEAPNSAVDDFHKRFPDMSRIEEEESRRSGTPPVEQGSRSRVPNYPSAPPLSAPVEIPTSLSAAPTRPPPAAPRPSYGGVSDRAAAASKAPTKTTTKLAPYIAPKFKRLPRTGLFNFGVTCYMNATIQCLSATIPLTAYFLDHQYVRDLQKENWKGSKGLLPELYLVLLRNLWEANDVDTIRPTNFRKFCARLNREWGLDRQQDAKEFLEFLIDCLHEDLNVNWRRTPLRALTTQEEAVREHMPVFVASKHEWTRYLHRDMSRMTDLFGGQHISRLTCTSCRNSSSTYEAFYSISVEIPQPARSKSSVDIRDCLRSYCSAETLTGEEVWRCPYCKCEREAVKRIIITRAPDFLVVHFKRFSASHSERARKVHTPVDFPLKGFDLEPFMLAQPDPPERDQIARKYSAKDLEAPPSMTPPYKYDAYAVMRHLGGTIASGHYISLIQDRARGCWREFNDDRVTDFLPEKLSHSRRLQNEQAYIVFYQRVWE